VRAVVQRVTSANVNIDGRTVGSIGPGVVVLVGVSHQDDATNARWLADKIAHLRIWPDDAGKMNRSLIEAGGQALVVSQFTLYGDARRGRRPSFVAAAQGDDAEAVYLSVVDELSALGVSCATGEFGAMMDVTLTNSGPVTILLDSEKRF
jgi:D-tyrosyl-tRNA(Tyr) deacylase